MKLQLLPYIVFSLIIAYKNKEKIPQVEIDQLVSDLLVEENKNDAEGIKVNLQNEVTNDYSIDTSPEFLLTVNEAINEIPIIKKMRNRINTDDEITPDESLYQDIIDTTVMKKMTEFLEDYKKPLNGDKFYIKKILQTQLAPNSRLNDAVKDKILGYYNWIHFSQLEVKNELNYLGYIKSAEIDAKRSVVKVAVANGDDYHAMTMFVGTSPGFEIALYTICYFKRRKDVDSCPMKLGNAHVTIHIDVRNGDDGVQYLHSAYPELNGAQTLSVSIIGSAIVMLSIYNNFL